MIEITSITEIRNHLQSLKAVVFDLDDTLYGEKEYVRSGTVLSQLRYPKWSKWKKNCGRYLNKRNLP